MNLYGVAIYDVDRDDCDFCQARPLDTPRTRKPVAIKSCAPHLAELRSIIDRKNAER